MRKLIRIFVFSYVLKTLLRLIVGVSFANTRFLKQQPQFVLVANHNSHLDTMAILAALPPSVLHKVKPVAAKDHFGKSRVQAYLSNYWINTLLIERKITKENIHQSPVAVMSQAIADGYSLIIFPEGTRGQPEVQQPLKPGIAHLLIDNPGLHYIPIYLKGMGKAMPRGDNLIIPYNAALCIGTSQLPKSTKVKDILNEIQTAIDQLKIN